MMHGFPLALLVYIAWYLLNHSLANNGSCLACMYYIEDHFTFVRLEAYRGQRFSSVCIALNMRSLYTFWLTVPKKHNSQIL